MSDNDPHDPWASLAESLGAAPANDPPRPAPPRPQQPPAQRAKPPQQPKSPPPPQTGSWDDIAAELGVSGHAEPRPVQRPAPRPAAEPAPRDTARDVEPSFERPSREGRDERRRRSDDDAGVRSERPPRRDDDAGGRSQRPPRRDDDAGVRSERPPRRDDELSAPVGEATGERRGGDDAPREGDGEDNLRGRRRRRGRRGGRGRGRREDDRADRPAADSADARDAGPADMPRGDDEGRRESDRGVDSWESREPRPRTVRADDAGPRDEAAEPRPRDEAAERRTDADGGGDRPGERGDDDDRPRRRRRGRRGGRGRRRTGEGAERGEAAPEGSARGSAPAADGDDEPLPTSYGMRPRAAAPGDAARTDRPAEPKEGEEGAGGEGRGRRRRRRRGGEGRSRGDRESTSSRDASQPRPRTRGGRRSSSESRSSSFSRGRRDDFAPVAGRHEDDDEGLEFLGVEEAGQEPQRRPRAAEDEDILVESGLNTVLDVPSWVEAIGIVIAGNLDARNKGRNGERSR